MVYLLALLFVRRNDDLLSSICVVYDLKVCLQASIIIDKGDLSDMGHIKKIWGLVPILVVFVSLVFWFLSNESQSTRSYILKNDNYENNGIKTVYSDDQKDEQKGVQDQFGPQPTEYRHESQPVQEQSVSQQTQFQVESQQSEPIQQTQSQIESQQSEPVQQPQSNGGRGLNDQMMKECYYKTHYGEALPSELANSSQVVVYYKDLYDEAYKEYTFREKYKDSGDYAKEKYAAAEFAKERAYILWQKEYNSELEYYQGLLDECN